MQGLLAFVMHCGDVITGSLNDEDSWQDAFSSYAETPNAFVPKKYRLRWRSIILFAAKSFVQWVFGSAVSVYVYFTVSFVPLAVVTVIVLLLVITLEVMLHRKPKTGGPTCYGEFSLLTSYILRYHLIWWSEERRSLMDSRELEDL
jgi:hypothetical protein